MAHQVLRTIDDLAQVPDDELRACLGALRSAISEARRCHSIALREGMISKETPFQYPVFNWHPKGPRRPNSPVRPQLGIPIEEVLPRSEVRRALNERGVYRIEDLATISEWELLSEMGIGRQTVSHLRNELARNGLEFLPTPDPRQRAFEQSKAILALPVEARTLALNGLKDSAPVSSLGLKRSTLDRALGHGHQTVGVLRKLSLDLLCDNYGRREAREIYDALMSTDCPFACSAAPVELWRRGLVATEELVAPTAADTPIADLRPWLGVAVDSLSADGIRTLGALRRADSRGHMTSIRGIGETTAERIVSFLGAYRVKQPYRRMPSPGTVAFNGSA